MVCRSENCRPVLLNVIYKFPLVCFSHLYNNVISGALKSFGSYDLMEISSQKRRGRKMKKAGNQEVIKIAGKPWSRFVVTLLGILALALSLMTLPLTACKDYDGNLISGEFIGRVSNSDHFLVAVFVEEPDESSQREARAYVCECDPQRRCRVVSGLGRRQCVYPEFSRWGCID